MNLYIIQIIYNTYMKTRKAHHNETFDIEILAVHRLKKLPPFATI